MKKILKKYELLYFKKSIYIYIYNKELLINKNKINLKNENQKKQMLSNFSVMFVST